MSERKSGGGAIVSVFGIVLVILAIVAMIHFAWMYTVGPDFQYRQLVGASISNAKDAPEFQTMHDQLLIVQSAMTDGGSLGLTASDCARAWDWEKTRDMCMPYQRIYVSGIINRTEYYIQTFAQNNTQIFTDAYQRALENTRAEFDRNGPLDWVAHDAWLLKHYPDYYWGGFRQIGHIVVAIVGLIIIFRNVDW